MMRSSATTQTKFEAAHPSYNNSQKMPVSASSHNLNQPAFCLTCGILAPCRRALTRLFRVPTSATLSIRAFRFRNLRKAAARMSPRHRHRHRHPKTFKSVLAVFWPLVPPSATAATSTAEGEAARVTIPEIEVQETPVHAPVSSPETPAYMKVVARLRSGRSAAGGDGEEVEDTEINEAACRSFESCPMEMLVEEGKARDLQDVEELLLCWERLKSPVFVDLVRRFYGELCSDLFTAPEVDEADVDSGDGSASTSSA
ncbi:hypothetical protein BS78_K004800 [Paspalum vaginatum]|uniref:OVATE domain-containing protein n=1 Tax=Paspalum vaginatum TaxID=158149 RepID=A0A9W8CF63_9POAL|nr:hypothetical protein BS78_K004800 [Paspalum vaginatum]